MKLTIELVPKTCFCSNVRSCVTPKYWNELRHMTYALASHKCEICGGVGPQHPVECHEVWLYDDKKKIQRLDRMIALCPACHEVKHMGFAHVQGRGEEAAIHLAKINGMTQRQAEKYVSECFAIWAERSNHEWKLDLSFLDELHVPYKIDRKV